MGQLTRQLMGINGEIIHVLEHELFTNCSELMRQLMGINGGTVLARSAPKKNWERTRLKLGAHPRKTGSAPS